MTFILQLDEYAFFLEINFSIQKFIELESERELAAWWITQFVEKVAVSIVKHPFDLLKDSSVSRALIWLKCYHFSCCFSEISIQGCEMNERFLASLSPCPYTIYVLLLEGAFSRTKNIKNLRQRMWSSVPKLLETWNLIPHGDKYDSIGS